VESDNSILYCIISYKKTKKQCLTTIYFPIKGNGERHDSMLNTTMLLNVIGLLYGVIPMALMIFYILNLKI
jgi:hypothetical protein